MPKASPDYVRSTYKPPTIIAPIFTEAPPLTRGPRLLIKPNSKSNEGRAALVEAGIWTQEHADGQAKMQHRAPAKSRSGPFIAWDGEGLTENGRHNYVMLCNSEGEILRRTRGSLGTAKCLTMLCNTAMAHPNANHVVFGGSYDANMMLADLSYYDCQKLSVDGYVYWENWRIEYRPRKFLMVTQYSGRRVKQNKMVTVTLWDVIGFFQMSFVRALKEWQIGDIKDFEFVERMKATRSTFKKERSSEIERYCFVECSQLVEVMTKLRNSMRAVQLTPQRWDGAGALGATMLRKHRVVDYKAVCPPAVNKAAQYGYFGGRIELVRYGNYERPVYAHDIVSAYPYAMTKLPCLAHGEWVKSKTPRTTFAISLVEYVAPDMRQDLFPLPWRHETGNVYFPVASYGWFWRPEIDMLTKWHKGDYKIKQTWNFVPGCDHQPFGFIPSMFANRQQLKRKKNLAEKVLKLGMNSIYGKLCQQVGSRDGEPPRYHQLEWAGYITSFTRARIYDLAMQYPTSVIGFETDGLYSMVPHDTGDDDTSLGSWEVKEYEGITYVQSGVYWVKGKCDRNCYEECDSWHPKYRGFDPGSLNRQTIVDAWENGQKKYAGYSTRFAGLVASSISPERFVDWRQWVTTDRTLTLAPAGKRVPRFGRDYVNDHGLIMTWATGGSYRSEGLKAFGQEVRRLPDVISAPHKLAWIDGTTKTLADERYVEEMEDEENDEDFV